MSGANACGSLAILVALASASCGPANGVEQNPEKSNKWLDLAKSSLGARQLEAAENEASKAIAFNTENDEAYVIRGLISFVRAAETQRTLEVENCLTGVDAEATRADLDAQLKKADVDFEQAIKVSPDYGEAWSNRGTVYTLTEDFDRSVEMFQKALENPFRLKDPALTRAGLGWAYFHQKKFVEAAKELRTVLQFKAGMCVATYRLGRVYFAREEWEKAAESLQVVFDDAQCGSQESSYYLMKTRMQQGLNKEARDARDACLTKFKAKDSCYAQKCRADGAVLGN